MCIKVFKGNHSKHICLFQCEIWTLKQAPFRSDCWRWGSLVSKSPARSHSFPEKGLSRAGEYDVHWYLLRDANLIPCSQWWPFQVLPFCQSFNFFHAQRRTSKITTLRLLQCHMAREWCRKVMSKWFKIFLWHILIMWESCENHVNVVEKYRVRQVWPKTHVILGQKDRNLRRRHSFRRCTRPSTHRSVASAQLAKCSWGLNGYSCSIIFLFEEPRTASWYVT